MGRVPRVLAPSVQFPVGTFSWATLSLSFSQAHTYDFVKCGHDIIEGRVNLSLGGAFLSLGWTLPGLIGPEIDPSGPAWAPIPVLT